MHALTVEVLMVSMVIVIPAVMVRAMGPLVTGVVDLVVIVALLVVVRVMVIVKVLEGLPLYERGAAVVAH